MTRYKARPCPICGAKMVKIGQVWVCENERTHARSDAEMKEECREKGN